MNIRLAKAEDLNVVLQIYADARAFMKDNGNPNQWGKINPPPSRTIEDIKTNKLHVVCDGDVIIGVFFFDFANAQNFYFHKFLSIFLLSS